MKNESNILSGSELRTLVIANKFFEVFTEKEVLRTSFSEIAVSYEKMDTNTQILVLYKYDKKSTLLIKLMLQDTDEETVNIITRGEITSAGTGQKQQTGTWPICTLEDGTVAIDIPPEDAGGGVLKGRNAQSRGWRSNSNYFPRFRADGTPE